MYNHKTVSKLNEILKDKNERENDCVFCYRISQYDDDVKDFLKVYYAKAIKNGIVIKGKIANPSENDLSVINTKLGDDFQTSKEFIEGKIETWLCGCKEEQVSNIARAMLDAFDVLHKMGKNENMIKNAYIRYMCWLAFPFKKLLNGTDDGIVPNVLYVGDLGIYELLFLSIISQTGSDIVIVEVHGDSSYQKVDPNSKYFDLYKNINGTKFPDDFDIEIFAPNECVELTNKGAITETQNVNDGLIKVSLPPRKKSVEISNSNNTAEKKADANPGFVQNSAITAAEKTQTQPQIQPQTPSGIHFKMGGSKTASDAEASTQKTENNKLPTMHIKVAPTPKEEKKVTLGVEKNFMYGGLLHNCTNAWIEGKPFEDIRMEARSRGTDSSFYYNAFCRIRGVEDKVTYANTLFQFQQSIRNAKRNIVIIDHVLEKPSTDEIASIKRRNYERKEQLIADLSHNIVFTSSLELQEIVRGAFEEIIYEEIESNQDVNINRISSKAVYLICWLKRYQANLFKGWRPGNVSCFIYLGGCKDDSEAMFVRFLALLPVDVLVLVPNLNDSCCLASKYLFDQCFENSLMLERYPQNSSDLHIATVAYHAERELDTLMYSDSDIFRVQQYSLANSIPLHTMYEEIRTLWDVEVKYRQNFSTVDNIVNIPVVFSKISGIKNGDVDKYWQSIKELITNNSFVVKTVPFIEPTAENSIKPYATEFIKNGRLMREKIRNHKAYQYGILREEMQNHIFEKLQIMLDERIIKGTFQNGTEYTVISTVLNLNKEMIRTIQKIDFTKKNPKLIYINTSENLIGLEDAILAEFLSLIGFDVIFFVPTGYQSVERFYSKKIMEEHQIGEFIYDLTVPDFDKIQVSNTSSDGSGESIKNLFKRGIKNGFRL